MARRSDNSGGSSAGQAGKSKTSRKRNRSRARFTAFQRSVRKKFRSAVAFLKRKGLLPSTIDARKVVPNKALRKVINRNKALIEKKETAYKLPDNFPKQALKDLKAAGYRVEKGKLIVPSGQYVRGGQIYTKPVGNRPGSRIETLTLGPNFEAQIREAFDSLKQGEWIGFSLDGHNSYNIYSSADSMLFDMNRYVVDLIAGGTYTHLTIFRTTKPDEYLKQRTKERLAKERTYERNKRKRARERRRAVMKGMRVTRGH